MTASRPSCVDREPNGRSLSALFAQVLLLVFAAVASGCSGGKSDGHVAGTPSTDEIAKRWEKAGLPVTETKVVDPNRYGAGYCATSRVSGVEVLICEFSTESALESAKKQLESEWEQHELHTAVAVRAKRTLVALIDRARADSDGRTINKMVAEIGKL
jgi:hypothetical protein